MAGMQIGDWDAKDRWVPQDILSFVRDLEFSENSQEARYIASAFMHTVQHLTKFLPPDEQFDFAWKIIVDNPYGFSFDQTPDIGDEEYIAFAIWLKNESNLRRTNKLDA